MKALRARLMKFARALSRSAEPEILSVADHCRACSSPRFAEMSVVPLLLETWNSLMPYLAHLAEVYDLIGA